MGKIVWLASYPKSGNTWLRVFLHNYITQPDSPHSINRLTDFSLAECAAALFCAPGERLSDEAVQSRRPHVHEELAALGPELVFVKTHNANLAVHGTALVTPSVTAGAVYVVRDPRDVAVSYAAYLGRGIDETIEFMAAPGAVNGTDERQVFELLSSWSGHVRSWVGGRQRLLVRYEDLVAEPERYFARIIRYLGTGEVDRARLARAIEFSSFKELAGQEAREGYAASGGREKFFRAGRAGGWREVLSPAQAARIERDHGEVMRGLGYAE
ncbi:sulfotransferase domain-containing protein [Acidocella sp.]|uniref:sulfotransferase domain-containing protein n=1 Tax=Acidocella sp. TaxID=50710 RepID=UPI002630A7EA|nr:sulfotransferase domain-containing protein [Acidocella sp.]